MSARATRRHVIVALWRKKTFHAAPQEGMCSCVPRRPTYLCQTCRQGQVDTRQVASVDVQNAAAKPEAAVARGGKEQIAPLITEQIAPEGDRLSAGTTAEFAPEESTSRSGVAGESMPSFEVPEIGTEEEQFAPEHVEQVAPEAQARPEAEAKVEQFAPSDAALFLSGANAEDASRMTTEMLTGFVECLERGARIPHLDHHRLLVIFSNELAHRQTQVPSVGAKVSWADASEDVEDPDHAVFPPLVVAKAKKAKKPRRPG